MEIRATQIFHKTHMYGLVCEKSPVHYGIMYHVHHPCLLLSYMQRI